MRPESVDLSPVVQAVSEVKAEVRTQAAATVAAIVAVSSTDNSTADKWVNRSLAVTVGMVALTYPVGKLIWIMGGLFKRSMRRG
jgi:hypothetical protein